MDEASNILILSSVVLFILLSPGLLLNVPGLTKGDAVFQGVSYDDGGAVPCGTDGTTFALTTWKTEAACKDAVSNWTSGYMSQESVLVHAVIFGVALYAANMLRFFARKDVGKPVPIFWLMGLFVVLSPGMFLTLPPLSKDDCGSGHKNIAALGGDFCEVDATSDVCKKCTSPWMSGQMSTASVFVHAIIFGVLAYMLKEYNYLGVYSRK
jgi:hypothetical protein